ncbi:MAG: ADP-ribosylglycohydrolase family protein [candidate division Zixibacteria bacterium]|nr:ADP-ribosylglycohydrolase family protein [candidate division Zixibacteria bacterium]
MELVDRFRGCLLGLAVGDAVGTTAEFKSRGAFTPLTDMVGGGPFRLRPGAWTDDTSMALCLATSLVESEMFDADDQMKRYLSWYENGYLSSNGRCFDIGNTVSRALLRYKETGVAYSGPDDRYSAGNGSIMRLAPIPMHYFPDQTKVIFYSAESSRTTHGAEECIDACRLLGNIIFLALNGCNKDSVLLNTNADILFSDSIRKIASGQYRDKAEDSIRGTGYVVESLEAALWSFWVTDSYASAVLRAANLGDDADTTAAICGQVAGAYYGESGIPTHWLERLVMCKEIGLLADKLYSH